MTKNHALWLLHLNFRCFFWFVGLSVVDYFFNRHMHLFVFVANTNVFFLIVHDPGSSLSCFGFDELGVALFSFSIQIVTKGCNNLCIFFCS